MSCDPLQNSMNLKNVVMLLLIVVHKLQVQKGKVYFNTFLMAD
jgi:hypothetical protein